MILFDAEPGMWLVILVMTVLPSIAIAVMITTKSKPDNPPPVGFIIFAILAVWFLFGLPLMLGSITTSDITICSHHDNTVLGTDQTVYTINSDNDITLMKIHDGKTVHATVENYYTLNVIKTVIIKSIEGPVVCNASSCLT